MFFKFCCVDREEQAKQAYQHKNIKIKFYKNNVAILYNKNCRIKQLAPTYVNTSVNGNNPKCQRTKNGAILYRIYQELKFQYAKKQQLNETIIQSAPGMRHLLANYMATHTGVLSQPVHRTATY